MGPLDVMLLILAVLVVYVLLTIADEIKHHNDLNDYNNESGAKPAARKEST